MPNREEQKEMAATTRIYEAVRARAPEAARAAIIAHMDFVERQARRSWTGSRRSDG